MDVWCDTRVRLVQPDEVGASVASVVIEHVGLVELDSERLDGGSLESPIVGDVLDDDTLEISGWVLGRVVPVVGVEIDYGSQVLHRVPLDVPRPDLARRLP